MAQRLIGVSAMGRLLGPALEAEEQRSRPVGAGDRAGDFGQRLVAPTSVNDVVVEHRDAVMDAAPLPDQHGTRAGAPFRNPLRCGLLAAIANTVKDPLRCQ